MAVVADTRLTPDAVRLVLFILSLGEGEHEVEADKFRELLQSKGDKPVYNARERAARCGYIESRQGGRKHGNLYRYLAPSGEVNPDTSPCGAEYPDTSPPGASHPAPRAGAIVQATEVTTTPTTPLRAVEPRGMGDVREYLTDAVVDYAIDSGRFTGLQLVGIVGMFGPKGTQSGKVWAGLDPAERQRCLCLAVQRFALDGGSYNNQYFEKYIWRARKGDFDDERGTGGSGAGREGSERQVGGGAGSGETGRVAKGRYTRRAS